MRLHYWDGQTELGDTRPLVTRNLGSTTLDVDLKRAFTVGTERTVDASPLNALLGVTATDSPTRRLDLAVFGAGLDWALTALRRKPLDSGAKISGAEAVAVIDAALAKLAPALTLLTNAAGVFAAATTAEEVLNNLSQLEAYTKKVGRNFTLYYPGGGADPVVIEAPVSDDLIGLAVLELTQRYRAGETGAVCGHCNCLFLHAERTDELYCRRPAPGEPIKGRTCRQVGPQKRYAETIDDLAACYRRRYRQLDQQARRGQFDRAALDKWRTKARSLLDLAQQSRWSADEFGRALDEYDPRGI